MDNSEHLIQMKIVNHTKWHECIESWKLGYSPAGRPFMTSRFYCLISRQYLLVQKDTNKEIALPKI